MKRYWKIAVLVPFIILCIGTYYIEASGSVYPDFYLKLQSGNEKEASLVSLHAMYRNQPFTFNSEGSIYQNEQSFWESLEPKYYDAKELQKLQKEHRQFMRNKTEWNSFYEDDQVIGYVNIHTQNSSAEETSDSSFEVSVYNKKRNESSSFKVKLPQEKGNYSMGITDVQIVGQTMKLVTSNYKYNKYYRVNTGNNSITEIHLYTLDLDKENITGDQMILSDASLDENIRIDILDVRDFKPTLQNHYAVFQVAYSKKRVSEDAFTKYDRTNREFFVYDLQSNQQITIQAEPISELLKGNNELSFNYNGDEFYLTVWLEQMGVRIIRFNLTKNKIMNDLIVESKQFQTDINSVSNMRIANERLYMRVSSKRGDPGLAIADLNTGGVVYQGVISRKDNKELRNLLIDDINIE
ncbi:MAG: hypothetical protein WD469_04235 [Paenibacillaceae bacterium]